MAEGRIRGLALLVAAGAASLAAGCGPHPEAPVLQATASPADILYDGSAARITVVAVDKGGAAGRGTVVLRADHGQVNGQPDAADAPLVKGVAQFDYACDHTQDAACVGDRRVTASWNEATSTATVHVWVTRLGSN